MQLSETICTQRDLRLVFGVHRAAQPAAPSVLRQIESEAQALAVSIAAGNHKLDYIANAVGKSRSYISRLQTGSAPIPNKLVMPLCAATGSLLLRQFRDLQTAIEGVTEQREVDRLAALLREAA